MILQENLVVTYDFTRKFSCNLCFYNKIELQLMILHENLVATYDYTSKFTCNL